LTGWSDLSGTKRPDKPWLDGLPRLVFLNDMGDTFTEGMDDDWFAEFLEPLAELPHIFIVLTKRARKGADFFLRHGLPRNFWFCVSVTGQSTIPRARELLRLREAFGPDAVLGLSVEPLLDDLCLAARAPEVIPALSWVKIGGESSQAEAQARPTLLGWVRRLRDDIGAQAAVFIKQLGTHPFDTLPGQVAGREMRLKDGHGGDWSEWPSDLRVREMPAPAAC
jgi:protein gp37